MFTWIKGNTNTLILTLYPNNITLNSIASTYFQNVRWCMIGIDHKNLKLALKPVTKEEIELGLVDREQLHKVSIGKGYGRISNKMIIKEISMLLEQPIDGLKIYAIYDEESNMLIADLNSKIINKGVN